MFSGFWDLVSLMFTVVGKNAVVLMMLVAYKFSCLLKSVAVSEVWGHSVICYYVFSYLTFCLVPMS